MAVYNDGTCMSIPSEYHNPHSGDTETGRSLPGYRPGRGTLLFVEDEESLRVVISDFLSELGYRVLSATNGKDAIALSSSYESKIDLLLTDIIMPLMSGPELARKLRGFRPGMKVMYISGYSENILAPFDLTEPGVSLLQKPFTIKVLAEKLEEALKDRQ